MDSEVSANIVPADQANPRYFNIEGIPPRNIKVTIDQDGLVRIQGEETIELEPESGVKKCRKEIIDYKFKLPENADDQSIVSEIQKGFIKIKWTDKVENRVTKNSDVEKLCISVENNKLEVRESFTSTTSTQPSCNAASSRKHEIPRTPKSVRFQLPGDFPRRFFSDRPRISKSPRTGRRRNTDSNSSNISNLSNMSNLSNRVQFLLQF